MFVCASSRCFAETSFFEACPLIVDLEYDRIEIWFDELGKHLSADETAADPERFALKYREASRLTPVAFWLEGDVPAKTLSGLSKAAKMLRIAQITVPAAPLGTPFNTEVDRLREYVKIGGADGVRISVKTQIGRLTEDPRTSVELCQSVPGLGITLDPSHFLCGPFSNEHYDAVFPVVYHVHLRDSTPKDLQVPVGLGEIDYSRLITQLQKENYRLALSVDFDTQDMAAETRQLEMRKLRMLLDSLL